MRLAGFMHFKGSACSSSSFLAGSCGMLIGGACPSHGENETNIRLKNCGAFTQHRLSFFLKVLSSSRQVRRTISTSSRPLSAWWMLSVIKWLTVLRATLLKLLELPQPNWATTLYRPSSPSAAASDTYAACACVCVFSVLLPIFQTKKKYITDPQGRDVGWREALQNSWDTVFQSYL